MTAPGHAYRPEVDGLRAVAVLPVIFFHAGFAAFAGGFVGVDVFFVISGYLITSILLRERMAGTFTLTAFYERRARRILPALFLVMLVCIPMAWIWMLPSNLESFGQSLAAVSGFISNVLFWSTSGYFDDAAELKPLLHTWSLGVEEQFYVLFPLFVAGLIRFGRNRLFWGVAIVAAVSFGLGVWLTGRMPTAGFYLLPSRAWELLAGSLLACAAVAGVAPKAGPKTREALGVLGLALIMFPVFLYDEMTPFPGLAALPPVLGTVLILAFTDARTLVGRLLTLPVILWVGAISYSAYLWHQPLFAFARLITASNLPAWLYLALTAAVLGLAHLSWRYVEVPFRNRRRFSKRQILIWSVLGSGVFMATGLALAAARGAPDRFAPEVRPLLMPATSEIQGCPEIEAGVHMCRLGVPGIAPTVVLLGDSHAYMIATDLGEALARSGRAGVLLHTPCHPVPGMFDSREPPNTGRRAMCEKAQRRVYELATAPGLDDVIVAIRWTMRLYPMGDLIDAPRFDNGEGGVEGDVPWRRSLTLRPDGAPTDVAAGKARAVRDFIGGLAARKRTIILYPVPEVGWKPARLNLLKAAIGRGPPESITTSAARFHARNAAAEALLDSLDFDNLRRVRPADRFCDGKIPGRCIVQDEGVLYYSDDDHLSRAGAVLLVRDVLGHMDQ